MTLILIRLPFFRSISQGWLTYCNKNFSPKFTEKCIRMLDAAITTLADCFPVENFLDPITHSEVYKNLANEQFTAASRSLELGPPELDLRKVGCLEALKIGV